MEHRVKLVEDVDEESSKRYVMARDCDIDRKAKDTIKWKNPTNTTYTIHFDNSPFQGNDFVVPAHGECISPSLKAGVKKGTYPYLIQPPAAAMAADPNVIVH